MLQTKLVAHSVESAQLVRQAEAVSQAYPPGQSAAFGMHCPPAVQANVVSVDVEQVVAPQVVPAAYLAHWPALSHRPVVPQVDGGIIGQPASAAPALTAWQVPWNPGNAQVLQVPQLAAMQQNPSVQLPLKHSVPARQLADRKSVV